MIATLLLPSTGQETNKAEFDAGVCDRLLVSQTEVPVCEVGQQDQDGEEEEGDDCLPQLDDVGTDPLKDDKEPDVGEHREECRHEEHLDGTDAPYVGARDRYDANAGDDQEVERR